MRAAPHLLLIVAALFSGCQHVSRLDLQSLVGRQVHLEGRFGGPGKLADYVTVPSGQVYLFEPIDSAGQQLEYGYTVAVEGVLDYRSYPPARQKEGESIAAPAPNHYFFIDEPRVRILQ